MNKGDWYEAEYSKKIKGVPFLISSKFLRSLRLGQVDSAELIKNKNKFKIMLYELKYRTWPSRSQFHRLSRTQDYLARVLDMDVKLEIKFCQKGNDSLF